MNPNKATSSASACNKVNYGSFRNDGCNMEQIQSSRLDSLHHISEGKNKTQVAATTSMAVIHVGILKFLLDLGPDAPSHLKWSLYVVIVALVLQFISGVIAIYISVMKSFLGQFRGDFGFYCRSSICPCLTNSGINLQKDSSCCVCCIPTPDNEEEREELLRYEDTILEEYNAWVTQNLKHQMAAISSGRRLHTAEMKLADLNSQKETLLDQTTNENDPDIAELDRQISEERKTQERLIADKTMAQEFQDRGSMLWRLRMYMMEDKVMKRAAFLQCVLTVLTYIIFALNTVITGFGLSTSANLLNNKTNI